MLGLCSPFYTLFTRMQTATMKNTRTLESSYSFEELKGRLCVSVGDGIVSVELAQRQRMKANYPHSDLVSNHPHLAQYSHPLHSQYFYLML